MILRSCRPRTWCWGFITRLEKRLTVRAKACSSLTLLKFSVPGITKLLSFRRVVPFVLKSTS
ncbi:hypothetical protein EVA_10134 [gut metagenome]|uniref:Uncharacterized protein n=1 Tax=gut metagenome TaxID=749906 RepID=J9CNR7_9ZZZZ